MSTKLTDEKRETLLHVSDDELTLQEQKWVDKLAKVMSSGYGADRGCKPTKIRSGVFRGALLVLLPLVDEFIEDLDSKSPLTNLGVRAMQESLTRNKFLPLP
jgi:hypothetical protein